MLSKHHVRCIGRAAYVGHWDVQFIERFFHVRVNSSSASIFGFDHVHQIVLGFEFLNVRESGNKWQQLPAASWYYGQYSLIDDNSKHAYSQQRYHFFEVVEPKHLTNYVSCLLFSKPYVLYKAASLGKKRAKQLNHVL